MNTNPALRRQRRRMMFRRRALRWLGAVLLPTMLAGLGPLCPDPRARHLIGIGYVLLTGRELPPRELAPDAGVP